MKRICVPHNDTVASLPAQAPFQHVCGACCCCCTTLQFPKEARSASRRASIFGFGSALPRQEFSWHAYNFSATQEFSCTQDALGPRRMGEESILAPVQIERFAGVLQLHMRHQRPRGDTHTCLCFPFPRPGCAGRDGRRKRKRGWR